MKPIRSLPLFPVSHSSLSESPLSTPNKARDKYPSSQTYIQDQFIREKEKVQAMIHAKVNRTNFEPVAKPVPLLRGKNHKQTPSWRC